MKGEDFFEMLEIRSTCWEVRLECACKVCS